MKAQQICKINLCLLDTQVDIILKGLELYLDKINSKYKYRRFSLSLNENIEKSLARDTWLYFGLIQLCIIILNILKK